MSDNSFFEGSMVRVCTSLLAPPAICMFWKNAGEEFVAEAEAAGTLVFNRMSVRAVVKCGAVVRMGNQHQGFVWARHSQTRVIVGIANSRGTT